MPEEVASIRRRLSSGRESEIGLRHFIEGTCDGIPIVLAHSRIGKVSAAITTMLLTERFGADHVIFAGVAGALDPRLRIGDIVIADQLVQRDMDASPLFPRFEIPLLGLSKFRADLQETAHAAALEYLRSDFSNEIPAGEAADLGIDLPSCHRGLVASGDQFIGDASRKSSIREALPDALCIEMEGAAVAQVCHEMGRIPCAVIRIISDNAGHSAALDFQRFLRGIADRMIGGIVARLIQRLAAV